MAAVLIDTSVLIDAERRGETLHRRIGQRSRAISVITVSELLHGVHRADSEARRLRRQSFVERILTAIEPVPVSTEVARTHASLWAHLEGRGEVIGAHDLWIAATALCHGMDVASTNHREFARIPGLELIKL